MSNTIQIKRGQGIPADGQLTEYELGFVTDSSQLVIGIPIGETVKASGIRVSEAQTAQGARTIVNDDGTLRSVGSLTSPIYLSNGEFKECSGGTFSGTIEKAERLDVNNLVGSASLPVYFNNGVPEACSGTINLNATTATTATTAGGLTENKTTDLTKNRLQYFNREYLDESNRESYSSYWHIIRTTLNHNKGYYTELALPINEDPGEGIYFRQYINGGFSDMGWRKLIDSTGGTINGRLTIEDLTIGTTLYGTAAPSGSGENGQIYFQVI